MHTEKILRKAGLLAASGVVALALAALPVAPGLDAGSVDLKAAQAKGNGGGNGGGNGNAGGNGNGNGGGHGNAGGTASAGAGNQGNGHGNGVSTDSHGLGAEGHGVTASAMQGLNASHASIQGFANANANSMVGQIGLAVQAAFDATEPPSVDSDLNGLIGTLDPDEVDDPALTEALAGILGVEDLEDGVLGAVKGLVDDKVEVPGVVEEPEPEAAEETEEI